MFKPVIFASVASILAVFGSFPPAYATTECGGEVLALQGKLLESVEKLTTASTTVARAEVTAAQTSGSQQQIKFRLLNAWKGPFQVGESVSLTLPVTEFCGGLGCVFPFKVGDVTLLSTSSSAYYDDLSGCWAYQGIAIQRVLVVPAALMPRTPDMATRRVRSPFFAERGPV
jgi:hypothetical protein